MCPESAISNLELASLYARILHLPDWELVGMRIRHCLRTSVLFPVILANSLVAYGSEKPVAKPRRTEISAEPWQPSASGKVIYGTDDRLDVYQETNPERRAWAISVCALVEASEVLSNEDETFTLRLSSYRAGGLPPCGDEPYLNQPAVAFCTGFMVGPDLIATAGHCLDEFNLSSTRFVFGFQMLDANTPRSTFDSSEVYTGVEIVASQLEGDFDYAVVRLDRDIVAPGAQVLPLRTSGDIATGTSLGVIGYPAGLPAKIAFGETTIVRSNTNPGYFVANLDTYGGNSGSPVFNAETGVVEGILVRGEQDFEFEDTCFRSRRLMDNGGRGEEVSKATTFASLVQLGRGSVTLDRSAYLCKDMMEVAVYDFDLRNAESAYVDVFTTGGDIERVLLIDSGRAGEFSGTVCMRIDEAEVDSGVLEVSEGDSIVVDYRDEDLGNGAPGDAVATARVDCTPPIISNVRVQRASGSRATIAFDTNEPAVALVTLGEGCDTLEQTSEGMLTTAHFVQFQNLQNLTTYSYVVQATDAAGNSVQSDDGGNCYSLTTTDQPDFFTQSLVGGTSDLTNLSIVFTPSDSTSGYQACVESTDTFPTSPFCGEPVALGDDDFIEYQLQGAETIPFYGTEYQSFFLGSNGYVTFGAGDWEYLPSLDAHFSLPRISLYFGDLFPPAGGLVSVAQLNDRVAVSFYNVSDYYGNLQSSQLEMFFDGTIRMTWLVQTFPDAIVGISDGMGLPEEFEESDLSEYTNCEALPYEDVFCESGVPNDTCSDAIPLELNQQYSGSTFFASDSSQIPGCESCYSQDVWYAFTPAVTDTYTVSLCGSSFDTILDIFVDDCTGLAPLYVNDDSNCGFQSEIVAELEAGTTYMVRVSGYANITGHFSLTVLAGDKALVGCHVSSGSTAPYFEWVAFSVIVALMLYPRIRSVSPPGQKAFNRRDVR